MRRSNDLGVTTTQVGANAERSTPNESTTNPVTWALYPLGDVRQLLNEIESAYMNEIESAYKSPKPGQGVRARPQKGLEEWIINLTNSQDTKREEHIDKLNSTSL